jgi:hypothetical protein
LLAFDLSRENEMKSAGGRLRMLSHGQKIAPTQPWDPPFLGIDSARRNPKPNTRFSFWADLTVGASLCKVAGKPFFGNPVPTQLR